MIWSVVEDVYVYMCNSYAILFKGLGQLWILVSAGVPGTSTPQIPMGDCTHLIKWKSHLVTPLFSVTRKCKIYGLVSLCLKCITGGSLTGAIFNPALALSLHFKCFDEAFLQFFIVYWLAPSLGKHVFI